MTEQNDKNVLEKLLGGADESPQEEEKLHDRVDELKDSNKNIDNPNLQSTNKNSIGLDIGTSRIVSIRRGDTGDMEAKDEPNSFLTLPSTSFGKEMLSKNNMNYIEANKNFYILGRNAQEFGNILNSEMQRPMEKGLLKADEPDAIRIIKEIIQLVITQSADFGGNLCFSVPSPELGFESDLIYHESVLKKIFVGMGYNAKSITEGMAIVLSELAEDDYTGIGISMGGGMCNVCFSFLSVPILVFSISKGGDYVDTCVSRVVNETKNRVRVAKEESLDFTKSANNKINNAFDIYYDDLIMSLLNQLVTVFSQVENLPKLNKPIPIILAGGTCLPSGFKVKFNKLLGQVQLPVEISEVRMSTDPLRATARGALINAGTSA